MSDTMRHLTLASLVVIAAAIVGCSSQELSGSSSCREFMQSAQDERDAAVARVAEEENVGGLGSPLTRPNIEYICGNDPDTPLGEAVRNSGTPQSRAPDEAASPEGAGDDEAATTDDSAGDGTGAPSVSATAEHPVYGRLTYDVAFVSLEFVKDGVPAPDVTPIVTLSITNTMDREVDGIGMLAAADLRAEIPRSLVSEPDSVCDDDFEQVDAETCAFEMSTGEAPPVFGSGESAEASFNVGGAVYLKPDVSEDDITLYAGDTAVPTG